MDKEMIGLYKKLNRYLDVLTSDRVIGLCITDKIPVINNSITETIDMYREISNFHNHINLTYDVLMAILSKHSNDAIFISIKDYLTNKHGNYIISINEVLIEYINNLLYLIELYTNNGNVKIDTRLEIKLRNLINHGYDNIKSIMEKCTYN